MLTITQTRISEQGAARLRAALPHTAFVRQQDAAAP
jgi:hypothetical protein